MTEMFSIVSFWENVHFEKIMDINIDATNSLKERNKKTDFYS